MFILQLFFFSIVAWNASTVSSFTNCLQMISSQYFYHSFQRSIKCQIVGQSTAYLCFVHVISAKKNTKRTCVEYIFCHSLSQNVLAINKTCRRPNFLDGSPNPHFLRGNRTRFELWDTLRHCLATHSQEIIKEMR